MSWKSIPLFFAFGALALVAAQAADTTVPPVQAFFSYPQISDVQISPDGKYLAMVVADDETGENRKVLAIIGTDDRKPKVNFRVAATREIWKFWWANDQRVLIATATRTGALSAAIPDGSLYAINVDATQSMQLLGRMPNKNVAQTAGDKPVPDSTAQFTHIRRNEADKGPQKEYMFDGMLFIPNSNARHVLVDGWATDSTRMQALDVDVYSGDVRVVTTSPTYGGGFLGDANGQVRLAWGVKKLNGDSQLFYRDAGDAANWQDISALYKGLDPADEETGPLGMAQDGKTFYWRGRTADSTIGLFNVNPADMSKQLLYSSANFDVAEYIYGDFADNRHKIIAVETYPGLPQLHVIDQKDSETAVLLALRQAFPGQEVNVTSATRDGASMIVYVGSDRNPGDYYLFNRKTLKADILFSTLDQIDPDKMAVMQPVTLQARDGLTLHGYLTEPRGKPSEKLPLILLPHGGPHNMRDFWGWDPEVQFFASRGYAVLQVNFRGSGGYGLKFQSLGYRNWGTTMQDDLADAVEWAVKQGIADPNRICIYGASYGGYAALENVIRFPRLYKCAAGYVGVYDLTLEAKYGDVHRSAYGRNYLEIVNGNNELELKEYSPVFNAARIKVPVFIAYGGKDQRVVPDNAEELMAAMDAVGKKYEVLFYPYEAHGFRKPEDRFELYTRLLAFFDKYIGRHTGAAPSRIGTMPGVTR
ncbi:MAG TPA: S9 family peptidase [Gammaproteobacteria bacterium]|nr:S9 family peptidase [Gammaproteobacteria bacterium]